MIATRHRKTPWSYLLIGALVLVLGCGLYLRYEAFRTTKSMASVSQTTSITQQTTPTVPAKTNVPASTTNPTTTVPTTGTSMSKTQGTATDNGCGILDSKYCSIGKIVQYDGQTYVGLSLPVGGKILAPMDDMITLVAGNPNQPDTKGGSILGSMGNIVKDKGVGMAVIGRGLVMEQPASFDKNGNVTSAHIFSKGDVVATLQANDTIPGLGSVNVLIRFASSDKTINTLFASEAVKVQNGQETVDQLLENMVKAVQGFTSR